MAGIVTYGFEKKTLTEIIEEKKLKAQEVFGNDIDLSSYSPLMKYIEITSIEEAEIWELAEQLYYSAFARFATGISLDRVGDLFSLFRLPASRAIGQVTFTGTNGIVVPAGTIISTSDGTQFQTDADGTVAGGTVDINITAFLAGDAGNVALGTITTIASPIAGITAVTNAAATSGGTDVETDADYRQRLLSATESLGRSTVGAVEAGVEQVSGVVDCKLDEDTATHSADAYVKGVSLPSTPVNDAIEEYRPVGIAITAAAPSAQGWKINPLEINVDDNTAPTDPDIEDVIDALMETYSDALDLGDDVYHSLIIEEIENLSWVLLVVEAQLQEGPGYGDVVNVTVAEFDSADFTSITYTINRI